MSNSTDFIDEDLIKPQSPAASLAEQTEAQEALVEKRRAGANRDHNLARMARHRDQLESQVATTLQEIERLRQRQEDFESERRRLEDLRNRQDEYVKSKREITQRLHQSLLTLEKEEVRASQLAELFSHTRRTFRNMLEEIEGIDESSWDEDDLQDDLTRAQDLLATVRLELNKQLAKLDTFNQPSGAPGPRQDADAAEAEPEPPAFARWLLMGLAIALPLTVFLVAGAVLAWWLITNLLSGA